MNKSRVVCAVRCSHCQEFGTFTAYTKTEGHFNGVFICLVCLNKGVTFEASIEEEVEKTPCKKAKKKRRVKKKPDNITTLLVNKPAKKPK